MKRFSRREVAQEITRQLIAGRKAQDVMRELGAYLVEHNMTNQADMILNDIAARLEVETGHTTATVRAAFALSSESREQIKRFIAAETGATSVELNVQEDPTLVGGVVIRTPSMEYDASVRRKLNQLARGEV